MAGHSEKVAGALSVDRFDIGLQGALHAVTVHGIKLTPRKPDLAKLGQLMAKAKKPAEFFLTLEGDKLTLDVRVGTDKMVLGVVDLAAEKDLTKRRAILKSLAERSGLASKADLDAFDKAHPDPADVAELQKRIEDKRTDIKRFQFYIDELKNFSFDQSTPALYGALEKWAEAHHLRHYLDFLNDIDAQADPAAIVAKYLRQGAPFPVNVKDAVRVPIENELKAGKKPNFAAARKEIVLVVNAQLVAKYKAETLATFTKGIQQATQELAVLTQRLKTLGGP